MSGLDPWNVGVWAPQPVDCSQGGVPFNSVHLKAKDKRIAELSAEIVRLRAVNAGMGDALREARIDIGTLLANLRFLEEVTGESLDEEDAALIEQIERAHEERQRAALNPTDPEVSSGEERKG